ncbi:MAG: hypothetical protein LBJ13_01510 [Puniceicoccales bacterium]|jgi:hypothetical protein|nr:hypothetical protein [Puniceicoccales bacterium]
MSGKVSLCIIFGLGMFSGELLGRPDLRIIERVRNAINRINSGELNSVGLVNEMGGLLELSLKNFNSFPDSVKELLGENREDDAKKNLSYNVFRLYAFPNDPTEIGNVVSDVLFRTQDFIDNNEKRRAFFDAVKELDVEESQKSRFQEIIACHQQDLVAR